MTEDRFEQLLSEIRDESVPAEEMAAARDRVWKKLAGATSLACAEFQPELDGYLAGRLAEARRLLVEDHLGRCAECRRIFAEAQGERKLAVMPAARQPRFSGWTRWAVAAGALLGALYLGRGTIDSALAPGGPRATVAAVSGQLYRVPQGALRQGAELAEGDMVRTAAGSRAVLRLADGSRVEMNQRTELVVRAAWSGQTVRLDRGDIIVEAAKQRRGGLRVVTRDSVASVKGTVFAVSSGAAGSLVSVLEGAVQVSQPGMDKVLNPGEKAATSPALERVEVRETVAWSQNAEKYYALLAEFIHIEKQLAEMPAPAWRTEAKLLRYLPAGTQAYFAIPNLSGTIRDALRLLDRRSSENEVLKEWWESEHARELRKTLDSIQAVTPLLGDEVLFVMASGPAGPSDQLVLMLAQIQPDRHEALKTAMDRLAADHHDELPYQITPELLLVSDSKAHLATMTARLGGGANSAFASEIARRYQRGVSWLVGLDIASFGGALQVEEGRLMGIGNMRYLFFEQRSGGGRDENEATLSFQGQRTGISSWLAAPGAAGSGEYVSPEAVLAFSASTRDPRQAFDEMLALVGQQGSLGKEIREFEAETGINIGNDIASSLGSDFTLAIERPTLPIPGWVVAFEALSPGVLDDTARRLVDAFNRKLGAEHPERKLTLGQETASGRAWNTLKSAATGGITLYWTYDRGYLVASTDRALALRAITVRETGSSLVRSMNFQQRFPSTSNLHHSGFIWFNTNGVLADLAGLVQNPAVKNLLGSRDPLLVVLDGEPERIHAASRTRLTSLILDLMLASGAQHVGGEEPARLQKELRSRTM